VVRSEKIRVMVTDDHPLMREGINAVIQGAEDIIVVADADNGQQALEMFRVHRPDVTLMDLQMPIMNGIDAIKAIALTESIGSRVSTYPDISLTFLKEA
jgi:YesN/AraC family two-component response regulator